MDELWYGGHNDGRNEAMDVDDDERAVKERERWERERHEREITIVKNCNRFRPFC